MNRRQMMKAFPALAAAATAVAHAMPAEAQAVTQQTPKAPPAYKGRLITGVIALSYRPQLEAKEMTYEDIVRVIADLGLEGIEMTGYWLSPMLNFPPGTPSTRFPRWSGRPRRSDAAVAGVAPNAPSGTASTFTASARR